MSSADSAKPLRRILLIADESAHWKVAGLRQLDRLALCLEEFAAADQQTLRVSISWRQDIAPNERWSPMDRRLAHLQIVPANDADAFDLVLSTRLFLYHRSLALLPNETPELLTVALAWTDRRELFQQEITRATNDQSPWQYLSSPSEISSAERRFLRHGGKSQDGLVSRYLNRPLSRAVSYWLLKLPIRPTAWSLSIFILPLLASPFLVRGTAAGFIIGCAIFQLYSILDGCDGEIARAKFLQSESGRRLDSLCDLLGNLLLAFCLGIGLMRAAASSGGSGWFYFVEGTLAVVLILLSEGIVFVRRARPETQPAPTKWNGVLYQRHHELFERSGILLLGEKFAWWVVQMTKRDMAMLGFLALAIIGWTPWILHLQVIVAGISSGFAGHVFLRPTPVVLSGEAG